MDVGTLRLPFRGWYGSRERASTWSSTAPSPHHILWPQPSELAAKGVDRQLEKAVEVLKADVETWSKRPRPKLQKASGRKFE
jgi:tricorn protease